MWLQDRMKERLKFAIKWVVIIIMIGILIGGASRLFYQIDQQQKRIRELEDLIMEQRESISDMQISKAETVKLLNERDWTKHWTRELHIQLADEIEEVHKIRNEILYYNPNISRELASYQGLWIYTRAKQAGIDPYKVAAVAVLESDISHDMDGIMYKSHKGATGMMQLTPLIAKHYQINPDIFEENIKGGAEFLADLEKIYDDPRLQLAHYNAGSQPRKALREYSETKNYVKGVSEVYESLTNN